MDALYHDLWARRFVAGQIPKEPFFRAPLYPTLLGIIYWLAGRDFFIPRLVGILFGMGTAFFTFRIGQRVFNKTVGLLASAILLFYWPYIYYETELLIPATLIFLIYLSFYLLFKIDDRPERVMIWFGSGLCFALVAITRPNILLFMPASVVWLFGRYGKKRLVHVLVFIIAFSTVVGAVTVRNYIVGKDRVVISSQAGINFFIGNNPEADGYTAETPLGYQWYGEYEDSVALFSVRRAEELTGREMKPSEINRFWFYRGLEFWREQTGDAVGLLLKKTYLFWNAYEIKNNKNLYFQKRFSWVLRLPLFTFGIVSMAGLTGVGLWLIRRRGESLREWIFSPQALLIAFVFIYMISVVLFFVCVRYRLPIVPVAALFAASWASEFVASFREKKWTLVSLTLAVFVILSIVLRLDPYAVRDKDFAEEHWSAGNSYQQSGRMEKSIEEYEAALLEKPDYVDAWVNLGNSYFALQRYEQAENAYQEAVELDPGYAKAYNNLAQLHLLSGEPEQALELALKAVEIGGGNAIYRNTLGEVYLAMKQYKRAEAQFLAAINLFPEYTRAYRNLAKTAIEAQRPNEAKSYLETVLKLAPNDEEAKTLLLELQ